MSSIQKGTFELMKQCVAIYDALNGEYEDDVFRFIDDVNCGKYDDVLMQLEKRHAHFGDMCPDDVAREINNGNVFIYALNALNGIKRFY